MSDYFPGEIWVDILSRLPSAALLRFRSVCKSWCSLISSSSFIHRTLSTSSTRPPLLFLSRYSDHKQHYSLHHPTTLSDTHSLLPCPFSRASKHYFRIVGSCHGLIYLSDEYFGITSATFLWNPSLRRFLRLPSPRVNFTLCGPYMFALGFGFSDDLDFKVVRLAYVQDDRGADIVPPEVEIFSLRTGSWADFPKSASPRCYIVESAWTQVFVQGSIHWPAYHKHTAPTKTISNLILVFHVPTQAFREMPVPEPLAHWCPLFLQLAPYRDSESIALFQFQGGDAKNSCRVWAMEVYGDASSWKKLYRIDLAAANLKMPLAFRNNGDMLMSAAEGELVSYDLRTRKQSPLNISGAVDSFHVNAYQESLALLNEGVSDYPKRKGRKTDREK